MSHHIYQTRGFIIHGANTGEADRVLFIFTEHLGFLAVNARAARKVTSKLRYSLSLYSFVRIALVRGKNVWRLTDAEEMISFHPVFDTQKLKLLAGICALVNRFVHGEEENAALFLGLEEVFGFLQKETLTEDEMFSTETLTVCRILSALGYIGENTRLVSIMKNKISKPLLSEFLPERTEALREISRALQESQL